MSNFISDNTKLGKDMTLTKNIIIEDEATIRDNRRIGYNVVIRHNNWGNGFFNFK